MDLIAKVKDILTSEDIIEKVQAIGICGSLARGEFSEKSDIDVFIVVDKLEKNTSDFWWRKIHEILRPLGRDVTVFVYTIKGIKNIGNWYVLRLASEGIVLYDKCGIKEIFKKIVKVAQEEGLEQVRVGNSYVWKFKNLKLGERRVIRLED